MKKLLTLKNILWVAGAAASVWYWMRQKKNHTITHNTMGNNPRMNNAYSSSNKPVYNSQM